MKRSNRSQEMSHVVRPHDIHVCKEYYQRKLIGKV